MTKFYVYEHWRLDRDECFYVGKGAGRRAYEMRRNKRNIHHRAIQAKAGYEGWGIEVRIVASGLTSYEASIIELERVAFWREAGVDLANIRHGGDIRSAEIGAKISRALTGKKLSEAHKRSMSEANKGRKLSDEGRRKLLIAITGRPVSKETREKIAAGQRGRKMPLDHQKKLIEAARTPEARAKQSAAKKGRYPAHIGEEAWRKIGLSLKGRPQMHRRRAIICLDDGKRFDAIAEAAEHYNIDGTSIQSVCRQRRHSAGGRKFKYEVSW